MGTVLLATAALMFGIPLLTVLFAGSAGMAICFLLFYAVNPLYALWAGWFAGKDIRSRWFLPPACAVMYLLGTWMLFDFAETAFILYAGIYLILGLFTLLVSGFIHKKKG